MNDSMKEFTPQPREVSSTDAIEASLNRTISNRFKNLIPEKARAVAKAVGQRAILTATGISLILGAGCGNTEKIPTPTDTEGVKVTIVKPSDDLTVRVIPAESTEIPALTETPDSTPTPEISQKQIEVEKEYKQLTLPFDKYLSYDKADKMEFEEIEKILSQFRNINKGERLNYEEVLSMANFDAYIIGETHYPYMGQYENVADLVRIGLNPTVVGLEFVNEHFPEGKELVEKFNNGSMSLSDVVSNYRISNEPEPFLNLLREKQIPIAGIEPIERDPDDIAGGPERYKGITDWAVDQVRSGERPLIYVGDLHTSSLAVEEADVLVDLEETDKWRYGSSYLLKERLEDEGFETLTIHLSSKTSLAWTMDKFFERIYQHVRPEDRKRFMDFASSLYEEVVRPNEDDAYFIKVRDNEYNSVFSDKEKPFIAPPKSAWISAQKFLEKNYPEELRQHALKPSFTEDMIVFSLAQTYNPAGGDKIDWVTGDNIIWVSPDNGEVVKAVLPLK